MFFDGCGCPCAQALDNELRYYFLYPNSIIADASQVPSLLFNNFFDSLIALNGSQYRFYLFEDVTSPQLCLFIVQSHVGLNARPLVSERVLSTYCSPPSKQAGLTCQWTLHAISFKVKQLNGVDVPGLKSVIFHIVKAFVVPAFPPVL